MRPRVELVGSVLRNNVRAYAAIGVPVAAVVKNDAYGWGVARVVREIDAVVDSYFITDEAEFWALRTHTQRPIRLLSAIAPQRLAAVCANDGVPNITTIGDIEAAAAYARLAARPVTVRVGVVDAAGWSGILPAHAGAFGRRCAEHGLRVEIWTHITSPARRLRTLESLRACVAAFRAAGAVVAGIDVASTACATAELANDRLRIGAGLFGVRLAGAVKVTCAIRFVAPVVHWYTAGAVRFAGYGDLRVPANRGVAVLRCGYGDGFPKNLAGHDDILSVGMQYTTRLSDNVTREHALIGDGSDLDRLADRAGISPHELITGLAQRT